MSVPHRAHLSQIQKNELCSGYIRSTTDIPIPLALNKLCLTYYEPVFYWNIRGKRLKQFFETQHKSCVVSSKTYFYNDIECHLELYPNGVFDDMPADVALFIRPTIPSNVEFIETTLHFIFDDKVEITTYKLFDAKNTDWGWTDWVLSLEECRKYKQLSFGIAMNVLNMKYKDNTLLYEAEYVVKLEKEFKKEWIINEDEMNELKTYHNGKMYQSASSGVGNNWCLACFPNGVHRDQENNLVFGVNLIQLPIKIKSIGVDVVLEEKQKDVYQEGHIEFEPHSDAASFYWNGEIFKTEWLNDVTSLHFYVSITVKYIMDRDGNDVPQSEWDSYHIVDAAN